MFSVDVVALCGELRLVGPADVDGAPDEAFLLTVDFTGYRTVPPWWSCVDPRTRAVIGPAAYPRPSPGQPSIFHGNGLVCAPWSRGAYAENSGPHGDWSGATNWERVPNYTIALTIGEMVDVLYRQTRASRGRFAPLPAPSSP